eukprot:CAMPEP_0197235636 /NCGR_PEP_ID=MMETSP1429-20130617/3003_1 /TAXON_ID=49237 /ORGANISM="Chaetoceros  sp., Strain UNC1202" /LENGTH=202 /DNA_ID=CAMNT_0042694269 /DNA_START=63 /DNA_END=671 /DNA_ORIENTATION=+
MKDSCGQLSTQGDKKDHCDTQSVEIQSLESWSDIDEDVSRHAKDISARGHVQVEIQGSESQPEERTIDLSIESIEKDTLWKFEDASSLFGDGNDQDWKWDIVSKAKSEWDIVSDVQSVQSLDTSVPFVSYKDILLKTGLQLDSKREATMLSRKRDVLILKKKLKKAINENVPEHQFDSFFIRDGCKGSRGGKRSTKTAIQYL